MTDEVTELVIQRKLNVDLDREVELCLKESINFSLLFVDIDHFKKVNDSFGHVVGSQLLMDLGGLLSDQVRDTDSVYRYGGDEFIVLMRNTKTQTVHSVATRMLNRVKSHVFKINDNKDYSLSVSIGIAEFPKDAKSAKEIIQFADDMMYKSKDSGRGKVFHVKEVLE
jgi:diguanylate cyclase (GGDEF)-like protein